MNIRDLINSDSIISIIKELGTQGRTYKSEAQFQFELAWALKEYLKKKDCENKPEVILEYYSIYYRKPDGKVKKFFTDIMIKDAVGNYIPIELKYKTVSVKADDSFDDYGTHGATDLGRFDYLWDVKRIQLLKKKNSSFEVDKKLVNFCGGYAVFLTNDKKYWEVTGEEYKDKLYYDYCIGEGTRIPAGKELRWKNDGEGTCVDNTWRNDHNYIVPLSFDKDYKFEWKVYPGAERFKYIVLEV